MGVKIGTYNLRVSTTPESRNPFSKRFWAYRMKRVADHIKDTDLDIVCVQEGKPFYQLLFLQLFLYDYDLITASQGFWSMQRNGIFYRQKRFELIDVHKINISKKTKTDHARNAVLGVFYDKQTCETLEVSSVHLSFDGEDGETLSGLQSLIYKNVHNRYKVIAGDFNAEVNYLDFDNFFELADTSNIKTTYVGFDKENVEAVIDGIYHSDTLTSTPVQIAGDNLASDHLLVYSTLNYKV